jgi:ribonucleotide monophosphatase NagD (HAD superfamily)
MHGFIQGLHFHFLLTSGEVARSIFFNEALPFPTPKKKFWVFGGIHPRFSSHAPLFYETSYTETSDVEKADFIHIGIPHIGGEDQTNPEVFRQFLEPLRKIDLPMICVNPDCFAHEGNPPRAVVRQGTIAALFESLGGKVHYIGKPYEKGFSLAMDLFRQQKIQSFKEVIMVGDTPETDIRGARNFGLASALITQTGVAADRIRQQGLENVLRSLPQSDYPNFLVERLANDV